MPLSEKEKQALKEKYKEQRRAMWAGESKSRRSDKTSPETSSEAQGEVETPPHRGEQTTQPENVTHTLAQDKSLRSAEGATTQAVDRPAPPKQNISPVHPTEGQFTVTRAGGHTAVPDETASQTQLASGPNSTSKIKTAVDSSGQQGEQTILEGFDTLNPADKVPTSDEVKRIKETIREHREETWEGAASTRSQRTRRQRQAHPDEPQQLSSSADEGGVIVLSWKLVVGVISAIIVLIGVGVLLGYWFAS